MHFYNALLFLVSSLLADKIIRIYIAVTYTFPQLCGADLTFLLHLPPPPPTSNWQPICDIFCSFVTVVQAGPAVHGKTNWLISSLHLYPICTTSTLGSLKPYYCSNWTQMSLRSIVSAKRFNTI